MLTTVISVMSRDRVGIVADVAARIAGLGGDLADLSQTTLRGFFTLIVIASFPDGVDLETVRGELAADQPRRGRRRQARDRRQGGWATSPVPSPTHRPTRSTCSRCAAPIAWAARGRHADLPRPRPEHPRSVDPCERRAVRDPAPGRREPRASARAGASGARGRGRDARVRLHAPAQRRVPRDPRDRSVSPR